VTCANSKCGFPLILVPEIEGVQALSKSRSKSRRGEAIGAAGDMPFLQDGQIYKITSVKDKNVIEVALSTTGAPLITKKWSNGSTQKFKVSQANPGAFQISSLSASSHGWDFQPANGLLFQTGLSGNPNQLFSAVEINPNSKICVIRSVEDGRCLCNMGAGKQLALKQEDIRDKNMQWKIETTY